MASLKRETPADHWVTVWASMPQLTEPENLPPPPFIGNDLAFDNTTIRQTLRITTGGSRLRIRLSNAFGLTDLHVAAVSIALPLLAPETGFAGSKRVLTDTIQCITFGSRQNRSVDIPVGALAVSNPVTFPVAPAQVVTVSIYLDRGQAGGDNTSHPGSRTQSWFSHGDHTASEDMTEPGTTSVFHWYFLSVVEIWQPRRNCALALIGDSITDGRCSTDNGNDRWPDLLFNRMQIEPSTRHVSVINLAAGGNRVLTHEKGPNVLSRLDRDVLAQPGVRFLLVFTGVNDIGTAGPDVESQAVVRERLIWAFEQIVERVHAIGILVFGATITPFGAPAGADQAYAAPTREATRQAVNDWMRTAGVFDAVIDFDAVLRDPEMPSHLRTEYNSGDYLHPNVSAFEALAAAVPLHLFA